MTRRSSKVFETKDRLAQDELADLLQAVADRIRTGSITLGSGDAANSVQLALPESMVVEMQVQDSVKTSGIQREFELEIKWRVDEHGAPVDQPASKRGFTIS